MGDRSAHNLWGVVFVVLLDELFKRIVVGEVDLQRQLNLQDHLKKVMESLINPRSVAGASRCSTHALNNNHCNNKRYVTKLLSQHVTAPLDLHEPRPSIHKLIQRLSFAHKRPS